VRLLLFEANASRGQLINKCWYSRAAHHIRHLLDLIAQFPRVNPSAADASSELDILKLSRQIQSRYRALCSTLGVKPGNIRASGTPDTDPPEPADPDADTPRRQPVWKLDNPQAMTF
jgi:hypothetical protein